MLTAPSHPFNPLKSSPARSDNSLQHGTQFVGLASARGGAPPGGRAGESAVRGRAGRAGELGAPGIRQEGEWSMRIPRVRLRTGLLLAAAVLAPLGAGGCTPWSPGFWPFSMGISTPIPVPPWVTERMEEKYVHKN